MAGFFDFEATARDAPIGIAHLDFNGHFVWVNKRYGAMLGLLPEQVVGRQLADFSDEDGLALANLTIARLLSGVSEVETFERRAFRANGTTFTARIVARLHQDESGRSLGVSGFITDVTEELANNERVRRSEAILSAFLDHAPVAMVVKDDRGRYLSVNRFAADAFRLKPGSVIGRTDHELYPEATADQCVESDRRVLAGSAPVTSEETVQFGSELQHFDTTKFTVVDPDAPGRRLICAIAIDRTASKRAEAALRESLDRFGQVTDNIDEVFFLRDLTLSRIVYVSSAYERMFGRSCRSLYEAPDSFLDLIHPDDVERVRSLLDGARRRRDSYLEYRIVRPDGEVRSLRVKLVVIADKDGQPDRAVGLIHDVTESRRIQVALDETLENFTQLTDNLCDVFWMQSADGTELHYVSPAVTAVYGLTPAECHARPGAWLELIHPDDRLAVKGQVSDGKPYERVYRIVRPDGAVRWIWGRGFSVRNEQGEIYRVCGISSDVTDRKEADHIITEQQVKLAASSKMAALGEMAAGLAHEINNPLAIIDGKLHLLARLLREGGGTTEGALQIIDAASATTGRIAKIVRAMRSFARDVEPEPFARASLRAIVDETLVFCSERFRSHGIDLRVSGVPDTEVSCRAVQISQVLLNLLNNAHDAAFGEQNDDQRWVHLDVHETPDDLEIAVEDSGRGIQAEHRSRLFQPFFTTKEIGQGTGLGLSVSRGIAHSHGGELIHDAAAKHTRFVLRLPRRGGELSPGSS